MVKSSFSPRFLSGAPHLRRPQDTNGRHRAAQGDGALDIWLDPGFPGFIRGISVGLIMVNPFTTGVINDLLTIL